MKRTIFLAFSCLVAFTSFADLKVETFTTKDGSNTKTYETSPVFKTCDQATWTVYLGGIAKNQGNMGADNFIAIIRGTKPTETGYGYLESDSIEGGIDSLSFDWNSNGDNASHNREWKIKISINNDSVGGIFQPVGEYLQNAPFYRYTLENLKREGKFVLKFENLSDYKDSESGNCYRFVMDNLSWTTYDSQNIPTNIDKELSTPISITYNMASNLICTDTNEQPFTLKMYNSSGEMILQDTNNRNINIEQLPSGLYIIHVTTGNGAKNSCKIMKH